MPDKMSLDDILKEYKSDPQNENIHVGRADAKKIIISTMPDKNPKKQPPVSRKKVSHEKRELFDTERTEHDIKTESSRKKVASAGNNGLNELYTESKESSGSEFYRGASQIRRMADSTRAKEAEKLAKSKKKRNKSKLNQTYTKETPEGEYMYTPPEFKKKKRTRNEILSEIENEGRKYVTDIVPSPKDLNEYTKKTGKKKSSGNAKAKREKELYNTERTKRIVDFNYYGDVQDVGRDIYELKETISTRVTILALTSFLSLYIMICSRFDIPIASFLSIDNIYSYLTAHLVLGLLSLFYSAPVITKGVSNLLKFKADSDSMTAVMAITCLLSVIVAFFQPEMAMKEIINVYMPVGILSLLFNAIGKKLILKRAKRNFNFVSQNFDRNAVVYVKDEERAERLTRGTLGDFPILATMRKTDFLTDFLRYSYSSDITDVFSRKAVPACLIVSVIVSLLLTFIRMGTLLSFPALAFGFSIFSMLICATSCISLPFVVNLPLERISKLTLRGKGILLGYQSVDDLYDANSMLVEAATLFPEGTVKISNIKVFSNTKLPEALLDAASLTYNSGSVLTKVFEDKITGRENLLYPVENFSYEEDMGLCGWIKNRRILLGNRELMESHNIEGIPTKSQEKEYARGGSVIYLSVSGNLSAMFAIEMRTDRYIKGWAAELVKKKICLIIKSIDPFITKKKIADIFGMPQEMIKVLPKRLHKDADEELKKTEKMSASMACTGRFTSMIQLLLGIKVIHSCAITGLIIQAVSILLGFILSVLLILSKAFETDYIYMSATAAVVYNLICTVVTCIAVNTKKIR